MLLDEFRKRSIEPQKIDDREVHFDLGKNHFDLDVVLDRTLSQSRALYRKVLDLNEIIETVSLDEKVPLTNSFIDSVGCSNVDFKDAIHLMIAKKLRMPLCTHDKKLRGEFSTHSDKAGFYGEIYKPEELIKPKK